MTASAKRNSGPTHYSNEIVRRMFVATADQNYITARWAFLNGLNVDFFWLGLYALEKYFKATLLLNGRSSKGYAHDIAKLYKAVLSLDASLSFGSLTKPNPIGQNIWFDETVDDFVKRVNAQGDPNNRYMHYGYVLWEGDLSKLDQLVWSVRRHCRPFHQTLRAGPGQTKKINWVEELKKSPKFWHLDGTNPIEKAATGKMNEEVQHALSNLNYAFSPNYQHASTSARISSSNPPLENLFERLKNAQVTPDSRQTAKDSLQWVLDNIQLNKDDQKTILNALNAQSPKASSENP